MRHIKEFTIKETRIYGVSCDICGLDVNSHNEEPEYRFKCTLRQLKGDVYPDADCREVKQIDFCLDCSNKLFEKLKDEGGNINEFDADEEVMTYRYVN